MEIPDWSVENQINMFYRMFPVLSKRGKYIVLWGNREAGNNAFISVGRIRCSYAWRYFFLTAQENVAYPMEINGTKTVVAMEYAKKLLKKVGILEEECMKFPEEFSGGEQQRIAIARALSTKAKIIIALLSQAMI